MPEVVPPARRLRRRMRRARRAHHTGSLGDMLNDAYIIVLITALYGWGAASGIRSYLASPPGQMTDSAARYWIAVTAALAAAGLAWQALRVVGPLLVTPAAQTWVFSSPVDRADLLRPRFVTLVAGAASATGLLGLAAGFAGGADAASLVWSAVAGAASGVAAVALAVLAQATGRDLGWARRLGPALVAGAVVMALAVIASQSWPTLIPAPATPSMVITVGVALVLLPVALTATVRAARALGRVDRAALTGGAELAGAATSAVIMLDPTMVTPLVEHRRWRAVGRVRPRPLPGRPRPDQRGWARRTQRFRALVGADLRRRLRNRSALRAWAALLLVMYAVAVALPAIEGSAHVVLAYLAAGRLTGGLRATSRSAGLRRALGGSDRTLRLAHLVVAGAGATLWYLASLPVVGPAGLVDLVLLAGIIFAAYRTATRPPMRYGGPVADTPFGMIPVDLIGQLMRGPDVVAVLVGVEFLVR